MNGDVSDVTQLVSVDDQLDSCLGPRSWSDYQHKSRKRVDHSLSRVLVRVVYPLRAEPAVGIFSRTRSRSATQSVTITSIKCRDAPLAPLAGCRHRRPAPRFHASCRIDFKCVFLRCGVEPRAPPISARCAPPRRYSLGGLCWRFVLFVNRCRCGWSATRRPCVVTWVWGVSHGAACFLRSTGHARAQ